MNICVDDIKSLLIRFSLLSLHRLFQPSQSICLPINFIPSQNFCPRRNYPTIMSRKEFNKNRSKVKTLDMNELFFVVIDINVIKLFVS